MRSIATQPGSTHSGRSELLRGCFCLRVFADVASHGRNARGLHSKQAKLKINCERFQSRECRDSHLIPIVLAVWKLNSYHHSCDTVLLFEVLAFSARARVRLHVKSAFRYTRGVIAP